MGGERVCNFLNLDELCFPLVTLERGMFRLAIVRIIFLFLLIVRLYHVHALEPSQDNLFEKFGLLLVEELDSARKLTRDLLKVAYIESKCLAHVHRHDCEASVTIELALRHLFKVDLAA